MALWTVVARLLCLWDSLGKNTGVGCHLLLQGIFRTQPSNPGLLPYRQILYQLSHQGKALGSAKVTLGSAFCHQLSQPLRGLGGETGSPRTL